MSHFDADSQFESHTIERADPTRRQLDCARQAAAPNGSRAMALLIPILRVGCECVTASPVSALGLGSARRTKKGFPWQPGTKAWETTVARNQRGHKRGVNNRELSRKLERVLGSADLDDEGDV